MGNRCVITTPERKVGIYTHWNGGRSTIEPLLKYCELQGYRSPDWDCYGFARLCQVLGNYFGGSLSVGVTAYTTDEFMNPGDNGIYIIKGWKIVERIFSYEGYVEDTEYPFDEMLRDFDRAMPESEQIGEFLDSIEIPTADVRIGDEVWMRGYGGSIDGSYKVIGIGNEKVNGIDRSGIPYVNRYDADGDFSMNCNNYITGETCRIKPRK